MPTWAGEANPPLEDFRSKRNVSCIYIYIVMGKLRHLSHAPQHWSRMIVLAPNRIGSIEIKHPIPYIHVSLWKRAYISYSGCTGGLQGCFSPYDPRRALSPPFVLSAMSDRQRALPTSIPRYMLAFKPSRPSLKCPSDLGTSGEYHDLSVQSNPHSRNKLDKSQ